MSETVKILLIDDHSMVRDGIRVLIERNPKYKVIGEAGTAKKGMQLLNELLPDIVILDIDLPDQSGLHLISKIREASPRTEVMMLSMYYQQNYINKALEEGAKAYVVKESGHEKLLKALAALEEGDIFIDGKTGASAAGKQGSGKSQESRIRDEAYESLTNREQEVMVLLSEGLTVKEIANKIFISARTVENHRSNIFRKLGTQSLIDLVRYAARLGLIDLDTWK